MGEFSNSGKDVAGNSSFGPAGVKVSSAHTAIYKGGKQSLQATPYI